MQVNLVLTALTVVARWTCDANQTIVYDWCQLPEGIIVAVCEKTPANLRKFEKMTEEFGPVSKPYFSIISH
jgi:hypothetical protein